VSVQPGCNIGSIGERIDPGFRNTRALFDNGDMAGIQALAVRQAEAGACYLNIGVAARCG
jgi:5-methyltetrahydrofolate--homocysteine methyltransferase